MGAKFRNTGAKFTRKNGTVIHRGVSFEPTAEELQRKRHKLEYVSGTLSAGQGTIEMLEGEPEPEEDCGCDESDDGSRTVEDYHTGGGWYTLPGGARVRGREAALEALGGQD